MIEKIDFPKRDYADTEGAIGIIFTKIADLSSKLNEVIEAVNKIETALSSSVSLPGYSKESDWTEA